MRALFSPEILQAEAMKGLSVYSTAHEAAIALSPFLIGRMFLREPSWKYSAKLVGS